MKIVGRILISMAGAVALVGAAVAGCSTTNNLNSGGGTSNLGETCTRTFDCKSPLVCEQNVCLMAAAAPSVDGGTVDGGEAGTSPAGPHLGELNESCQTSSDCESPLACIEGSCRDVNYGLTVTGKACAECNTATDCCELPVGFNPGFLEYEVIPDGGFSGPEVFLDSNYVRCQDLVTFVGGDATVCSTIASQPVTEATEEIATACFYYNTYCAPCAAAPPWACTNNSCTYTGSCTATGTVTATRAGACPTQTRLGNTAGSGVCNSADGGPSGTCSAGCSVNSDCAGKTPADGNHPCSAADAGGGGNCICYAATAKCYFSCSTDLDCAAGKACDPTSHLCKAEGCTTDTDCVQSLGNPMGKCVAGVCSTSCTKDTDCNPPTQICSAGLCMYSGCTSDVDCTSTTAHSFCVTAPPAPMISSAITN